MQKFANSNAKDSVLSNCTFINCSSKTRSGGAICWKDTGGKIVNNQFIGCYALDGSNSAGGQAGAILFDGSAKNNQLINNTFTNCSSITGGAIYYRANNTNNTHINCTFTDNHAEQGGALYFVSSNNTYENCNFTNNSAVNGGSIYYTVNNGIIISSYEKEDDTSKR